MTAPELPDHVRRLIRDCVPTLEALEIVLLMARDPGRDWSPHAVTRLIQPGEGPITDSHVLAYLQSLAEHGVLVRQPGGAFAYQPRGPELVRAVEGLIVAYHQRPVTLIRTIYEAADLRNIRNFADAFRLRRKD